MSSNQEKIQEIIDEYEAYMLRPNTTDFFKENAKLIIVDLQSAISKMRDAYQQILTEEIDDSKI